MVDRTPEIATLLRQKPAAEGRIQGIGRHNATSRAPPSLALKQRNDSVADICRCTKSQS
jgi:hypothetical protein